MSEQEIMNETAAEETAEEIKVLTREEKREAALCMIYAYTVTADADCDDIIDALIESQPIWFDTDAEELFKKVIEKHDEADEIITKFSEKKAFSRISKIDVAILRLAIYEICYRTDVITENAAISEAVRLAKTYALDSDVRFINGLLGAYSRSRKADK